jgi:hypothetical protein
LARKEKLEEEKILKEKERMQLEIEEIAKKVKKLQKIKSVSMRSLTLGMR